MSLSFNPADWYWFVAGNQSQLYSSKVGTYVQSNNAGYQSWLNAGGLPSSVNSETELGDVLASYILSNFPGMNVNSTVLTIQQDLRQAQLDLILVTNADMVTLVKAGQSTTLTGPGLSGFLATSTNNYRALRAQIAAAITPADVRAVPINSGWPNNP